MNDEECQDRVRRLASRLLDGLASPEERRELNELLRGDPVACEAYLELAEMHALLNQASLEKGGPIAGPAVLLPFGDPRGRSLASSSRRRGRASLWRQPWLSVAAAVILLVNALAWWRAWSPSEVPSQLPGVAVVSRVVDPEWSGALAPAVGDTLPPGRLHLRGGLAQIEFFSGATLIVEGPAELDLASAWRVVCHQGRLRAFVPEPAQGFVVSTPDYEAVDLGTEFALSVGGKGQSEIHVVKGEVRLDAADGRELQLLGAGRSVRARDGQLVDIESREEGFVDQERLLQLARDDWHSRYADWRQRSQVLSRDPDMLVYFDFEGQDPWDRALLNRSAPTGSAAIIGAQWTQGRWPGKGGLEFKRISDRVRLRVPGEHEALTLSAWVRVEGFERWLNSLMLTDGWETGEVHWQISDKGELILGVSEGPNSFSPPVIQPRDLGRWMHLAVTVDGHSETGRIVHYLDGEPVGETVSSKPLPRLRLGDAEIGNWQVRDLGNPHPIRSLNGRIDDFFILGRALSAEEIAAIYRAGLPNG